MLRDSVLYKFTTHVYIFRGKPKWASIRHQLTAEGED